MRAKLKKREGIKPWLMMVPAIVIFLSLGLFPLIYSLWISFHSYSLLDPARGIRYIGGWNYVSTLIDPGTLRITFLQSLRLNIIFLAACLSLEIALGLGGALLFSQSSSKIMEHLRILVLAPMLLAPVIVGYVWRYMYQYSYGLLNYFLNLGGISSVRWLSNSMWAMISLVIADVWEWTPFSFLILLAAILSIPQVRLEAARVDGASGRQIVIHVILPAIKKALSVILLIRGIELIRSMDLVYTITVGGPSTSTHLLSFCSYLLGFKYFEVGKAAAFSYLMLIPINILIILFINTLLRGEK